MNRKPSLLLSTVIAGLALAACNSGAGKAPAAAAPAASASVAPATATTDARQPLYWYDPMVPDKHFDKPGKSPFMDMQLVPKYADEPGAALSPTAGKDAAPGKPQ